MESDSITTSAEFERTDDDDDDDRRVYINMPNEESFGFGRFFAILGPIGTFTVWGQVNCISDAP